jgi:hypothetical protein
MPSDCLHVGGFRVSFTPLTGVLFTVPSQYSSAIGRCRYLALESGLPSFRRPSTGAAVLACQITVARVFGYGPLTLYGRRFPVAFPSLAHPSRRPVCGQPHLVAQPRSRVGHSPHARNRFRLFPVRSPLLGESVSSPRGTKMFQFPRFPHHSL